MSIELQRVYMFNQTTSFHLMSAEEQQQQKRARKLTPFLQLHEGKRREKKKEKEKKRKTKKGGKSKGRRSNARKAKGLVGEKAKRKEHFYSILLS